VLELDAASPEARRNLQVLHDSKGRYEA